MAGVVVIELEGRAWVRCDNCGSAVYPCGATSGPKAVGKVEAFVADHSDCVAQDTGIPASEWLAKQVRPFPIGGV